MSESDLELVLSWRNHPEVRRFMYNQHKIELEEHINWFRNASIDSNRHLLIYESNKTPFGFANIKKDCYGVADWGFYISPSAPKGTGTKLGEVILRYAFLNLGLHKVCGQVIADNFRSIRFHERFSFVREGTLRQQYFNGSEYKDVICFGLLASEFQQSN